MSSSDSRKASLYFYVGFWMLSRIGDTVEIHADHDVTVEMVLGQTAPALSTTPATATVVKQVLAAGNTESISPRAGQ
jgi:hypothetical protein